MGDDTSGGYSPQTPHRGALLAGLWSGGRGSGLCGLRWSGWLRSAFGGGFLVWGCLLAGVFSALAAAG